MKFTLTIDPTVTETIVKVTAREVDAEVQAIQRLASGSLDSSSSPAVERPLRRLIGTSGNDATVLEVRSILAFFTKKKAVFAHTSKGDWRIKARMYELEYRTHFQHRGIIAARPDEAAKRALDCGGG